MHTVFSHNLKEHPLGVALVQFVWLVLFAYAPFAEAQQGKTIWADGSMVELDAEERMLWTQSDALEKWLTEESDLRYDNPELEAYLTGIASTLLVPILGSSEPDVRVHVLLSPALNAFALPNGALFLHTGMLSRMDSEAQAAILIGHELTHFTHRHQYAQMRAERRRMIFGAIVGSLVGAALGGGEYAQLGAQLGGETGQLFAMASVNGYSRNREREADKIGLKAAAAIGYEPGEGIALFEHLRDDIEAYDMKEKYFFSTHPRIVERINSFTRLTASEKRVSEEPPYVGVEAFNAQVVDVLLDNAELDLGVGREKSALAAIDKHLKLKPNSARGHFLRGEYFRHVGRAAHEYSDAIASYEQAIQDDESYASAYLALGLIYRLAGDDDASFRAFKHYLQLRPDALDRPILEAYLGSKTLETTPGDLEREGAE